MSAGRGRGMLRLSSIDDLPRKAAHQAAPYTMKEIDIQRAVLEAMRRHPKVAWAARMNTGGAMLPAGKDKERFVRFAFPGCSDIIGQTTITWGGRFIACEVKRPGSIPTEVQENFLAAVRAAGGVSFIARCVDDVFAAIPL